MNLNKKVPIERQFDGTSRLLLIGVKNNNATILYNKTTSFTSHCLNSCDFQNITRSSTWLEVV